MELVLLWEQTADRLAKMGTHESLVVAKRYTAAVDILKRTYTVDELMDIEEMLDLKPARGRK